MKYYTFLKENKLFFIGILLALAVVFAKDITTYIIMPATAWAQHSVVDPALRALEFAKFDGGGNVKVAISSGISNPLPVSVSAADKVPSCVLTVAPTCMTVTDTEEEITLPATIDDFYLITVQEIESGTNAGTIDCIAGAAPEAVYGTTGLRFPAKFIGYLYTDGEKFSCDAPTGKNLYVCAAPCVR